MKGSGVFCERGRVEETAWHHKTVAGMLVVRLKQRKKSRVEKRGRSRYPCEKDRQKNNRVNLQFIICSLSLGTV